MTSPPRFFRDGAVFTTLTQDFRVKGDCCPSCLQTQPTGTSLTPSVKLFCTGGQDEALLGPKEKNRGSRRSCQTHHLFHPNSTAAALGSGSILGRGFSLRKDLPLSLPSPLPRNCITAIKAGCRTCSPDLCVFSLPNTSFTLEIIKFPHLQQEQSVLCSRS